MTYSSLPSHAFRYIDQFFQLANLVLRLGPDVALFGTGVEAPGNVLRDAPPLPQEHQNAFLLGIEIPAMKCLDRGVAAVLAEIGNRIWDISDLAPSREIEIQKPVTYHPELSCLIPNRIR